MRNFQFAEEIDFTRSKKRKRRYTPRRWTLVQKMTVFVLILLFLGVLCTLMVVLF